MPKPSRRTMLGLLIAFALATTAWSVARQRQRAFADQLVARLAAGASRKTPAVDADRPPHEDLPAPVQRYLRLAVPDGVLPARLARFRQAGTLRTDTRSNQWMSFTADHRVAPAAAGFVWQARVALFPGAHLRVLDSLVDGRGAGQVSLMSALEVSAAGGTPEMNSGSLHRFLAEAVWYPTALLPSPMLHWTPIDDTKALATLTADGVTVSLEFRFNEAGEVSAIFSPGRWGKFKDGYRQMAWEGHFRDYVTVQGLHVPRHSEVGWYDDGVWRRVWEGTIVDATYE